MNTDTDLYSLVIVREVDVSQYLSTDDMLNKCLISLLILGRGALICSFTVILDSTLMLRRSLKGTVMKL